MLWKGCTQYASKLRKLFSGHRLEKVGFHSNDKEEQCQKTFKLPHNCTHLTYWQSNTQNSPSQACFNSTWTVNFLMFKRNQWSNCQHLVGHRKSKRIPEKHLLLFYWLCQTLWLCGPQQTGKFRKRWEYQTTWPLFWETCMQIRKQQLACHGTTDLFQIGKGVCQGYILSFGWFNFYEEYSMWNGGLDEAQGGIKIARENINNLKYVDDTTLWQKAKKS